MGEAFACDRCASFEGGKPALKVSISTNRTPVQSQNLELCSPCALELKDWSTAASPDLDAIGDGMVSDES